jgi:hypothetical protein
MRSPIACCFFLYFTYLCRQIECQRNLNPLHPLYSCIYATTKVCNWQKWVIIVVNGPNLIVRPNSTEPE